MFRNPSRRTVLLIWAGWVVVILTYQVMVQMRLDIARPDYAVSWTPEETLRHSQDKKKYLSEPFLNQHVAWDSEYYLAIAIGGYEDPAIYRIPTQTGQALASNGAGFWPFVIPNNGNVLPGIPLSYAFYPFYPLLIRLLSIPLSLLGMNVIATASLAGVTISLLGTLAAMLALYELARDELGEEGGIRAAFYLVIFPSGFFLAQIYTEGLFVGLAFWSLVLLRRGHFNWAALLAVLAVYTRAVGVALALPLMLAWVQTGEWRALDMEWRQIYYKGLPWKSIGRALVAIAPVLAFFLWRISYYGLAFSRVEEQYFGRGLLSFGVSFITWAEAFRTFFGNNPQAAAYYMLEWFAIILGFTACISGFRRHPDLALFGFCVVFLSFTSGPAQGMHRYILAAPPVFLFLSRLGRKAAVDKVWTLASVLIMGVYAMLYTFNMWTG